MPIKTRIEEIRAERPFVDHLLSMNEHYGKVGGSNLAGAVTYFGFLSFFPILAVAFAVIGIVANVYPDARENLVDAIGQVFPGIVVSGKAKQGEISIDTFSDSAPGILSIGLLTLLYSGLGWLSSLRTALYAAFEEDPGEQPNFVIGKIRDLVTLAAIGFVLVASVAVSSLVTNLSTRILDLIGLSDTLAPLLIALGVVVGLGASSLLFFSLFKLLVDPPIPAKALWQGALLGAIGFEALKLLSSALITATSKQPATQAFGIALVLVVWINYFSRVVMYAASWAYTSEPAKEQLLADEAERLQQEARTRPWLHKTTVRQRSRFMVGLQAFTVGSLSALGLANWLRGRR